MLQFILIVLLAQDINANLGSRNYYKPHSGFYRMQKGYGYKKPFDGYKKPVNTYKKPGTAVTPYCRCIKETTMLNLVVLDQSGTHLGNAVVSVGFIGKTNEAKTDRKGFLKVEVTGCEIGIIVWHNGKQAESRIVNLEKTKTSYKNVVIQIGKACNFLIYFYSSIISPLVKSNAANLISYLADINSGEQSTSGTAVVGEENSSPLCINVQDGGSLKVVVTSQSADLFSVLCLDDVQEEGQARLQLPFPITLFTRRNTFGLAVGSNVYRDHLSDYFVELFSANLKFVDENQLRNVIPTAPAGSRNFRLVRELDKTNYLMYIRLNVRPDWNLSGNIYIIDNHGVTKVVKNPPKDLRFQSWWVLGCIMDGNLKKWREINKSVPLESIRSLDVDEFDKLCKDGILPAKVDVD